MLHTRFWVKSMWELQCGIVESNNCIPYQTWARNLSTHVAKCMEIQDFISQRTRKQNTRYIMSKSLNTNCLDIFQGISIRYNELKIAVYFSLELYNNNGN
jgi:hypothetical protein